MANEIYFVMSSDGPVPIEAPELTGNPVSKPFPPKLWRITPGVNGGLPYTGLMLVTGADMWSLSRECVIRVYDFAEPQNGFDHNGLAILDPTVCRSLHNADRWDIELIHPIDKWGKWKTLLAENVLKIDGQLFRIDIQEPEYSDEGGFIRVHARHITGDLADELIDSAKFEGGTALQFLHFCFANRIQYTDKYQEPYEFEYFSDIDDIRGENELNNVTILGAVVGVDNCLINRYGGELYRNNFYFSVCRRMEGAKDNAFNLRYSLDMTKIKQRIDYTDFCTNLYAYDNFGNEFAVSYTPDAKCDVHHARPRIVKFHYNNPETAMDCLASDTMALWARIGTPNIGYEMQMAALKSDPRYADFTELQNYNYGDRGTIYCPELDIITQQQIIEIEKDELAGDIISTKLGNVVDSFIRPTFMGSSITTGRDLSDKQNDIFREQVEELAISLYVPTPIKTVDGKWLQTLNGKYLLFKKE